MTAQVGFDITKAAGSFAQISGLLAGFVFMALTWIVQNIRKEDTKSIYLKPTLVFLALTFMGNVLVAILWGLVSGDVSNSPQRPEVLDLLASSNFTLITALTLEALVFVVAFTDEPEVIGLFRIIFFVSVLIGIFYLALTAMDEIKTQESLTIPQGFHQYPLFFVLLPILTIVPLVIGGIINWQAKNYPKVISEKSKLLSEFVAACLIGISITVVVFGFVEDAASDLKFWLGWGLIINFFCAILLGWAIVFLPPAKKAADLIGNDHLPAEHTESATINKDKTPHPLRSRR